MVLDPAGQREGVAVGPGRVAVPLAVDLDGVIAGDALPRDSDFDRDAVRYCCATACTGK